MMMPDVEQAYVELIQKYRPNGILVGISELLLPPEMALSLLDELVPLGIVIAEVSCWYGGPIHRQRITESIGDDFDLRDETMYGDNTAKLRADLAKRFIMSHLPENIAFVSWMVEPNYLNIKAFSTAIKTPDVEQAYAELMQKYGSKGVLSGKYELLLSPEMALSLVDELVSLGIAIAEVSPWYYGDPIHRQKITEFFGYDFDLTDEVIFGDNAAIHSADLAKQFILSHLPENTALVSLMVEPDYLTIKAFSTVPKPANKV